MAQTVNMYAELLLCQPMSNRLQSRHVTYCSVRLGERSVLERQTGANDSS